MKSRKWWAIFAILALVVAGFISCDMDSNNPKDTENEDVEKLNLKFNLTGAKAIMAAEAKSGGRAADSGRNVLFKIMEDDTVSPIFDFDANIEDWETPPTIKFIAHSPVAGKKDLYICFERRWYAKGELVGIFIHVREDGSVRNLAGGNDANTWSSIVTNQYTDPVAFDGEGNLFFTVSEDGISGSTSVIWQYNPQTSALEPLTAAISGMNYSEVALSFDGAYVLAKGSRWDNNTTTNFLRLIPTANPDAAEYIYYSSNSIDDNRTFAYNSETRVVYLSGNNVYQDASTKEWQSGLFRVKLSGSSRSDWVWEQLLDGSIFSGDFFVAGSFAKVNLRTLTIAPDGSVWGFIEIYHWDSNKNQKIFARLIDSAGGTDVMIPDALKDRIILGVKPAATYVYYCADISKTGMESGTQNIYRFSYSDPGTEINMFQYITRNTNNIEISSYALGGDYLYFGGALGTTLLTGKVHLSNFKYTEVAFAQRVTTLVSY